MTSHEEALEQDWKTLYVLGELKEPDRSRFEEHFFDCPSCSEAVRKSYLLLRGAEATLKRPIFAAERLEAVAAPKPKEARRSRPWALQALPYAAILGLSVGAAFQYVALERARSPQAIAAFAIPAQAKGESQRIVLPASGEFVELELDLLDTAPEYRWEIKAAGADRPLMSGQARPPANAVALKLLVPANRLAPGRYEAAVSFPPDHKTVYPFEVLPNQGANGNR